MDEGFMIHIGKEIEEAITDYWGPRCPDLAEHCPCCSAWVKFDLMESAYLQREINKAQAHIAGLKEALEIIGRLPRPWKHEHPDMACQPQIEFMIARRISELEKDHG